MSERCGSGQCVGRLHGMRGSVLRAACMWWEATMRGMVAAWVHAMGPPHVVGGYDEGYGSCVVPCLKQHNFKVTEAQKLHI